MDVLISLIVSDLLRIRIVLDIVLERHLAIVINDFLEAMVRFAPADSAHCAAERRAVF
jgi:hypothetical protein